MHLLFFFCAVVTLNISFNSAFSIPLHLRSDLVARALCHKTKNAIFSSHWSGPNALVRPFTGIHALPTANAVDHACSSRPSMEMESQTYAYHTHDICHLALHFLLVPPHIRAHDTFYRICHATGLDFMKCWKGILITVALSAIYQITHMNILYVYL